MSICWRIYLPTRASNAVTMSETTVAHTSLRRMTTPTRNCCGLPVQAPRERSVATLAVQEYPRYEPQVEHMLANTERWPRFAMLSRGRALRTGLVVAPPCLLARRERLRDGAAPRLHLPYRHRRGGVVRAIGADQTAGRVPGLPVRSVSNTLSRRSGRRGGASLPRFGCCGGRRGVQVAAVCRGETRRGGLQPAAVLRCTSGWRRCIGS